MSLEVLEPGLATQVVDMGRTGWRSLGVSEGGGADRTSLALGNALVGNPPNVPALEITLKGPTLRATCDLACVIFGAPFDAFVDDRLQPIGITFTFRAGATLQVLGPRIGVRAYLCVGGGFDVPTILDSRSAFEPIRTGDVLACSPGHIARRFLRLDVCPWDDLGPLRVLPGPQADWFDRALLHGRFTVSSSSNRQGLRLEGPSARSLQPGREMVSEPVCAGAVQVTHNGQCIVLGRDAQTIGGYPKIAQVIAADLDRLGQIRPGQRLSFTYVSLEDAIALERQRRRWLADWLLRLRVSLDGLPAARKIPVYQESNSPSPPEYRGEGTNRFSSF